jgi:uncharacterized protein (TIGR00251 family)
VTRRVLRAETRSAQAPSDDAPVVFPVRVLPAASKSEIVGSEGGVLKVRVAAPPVKDKANRALVRLLAKTLGVSSSQVEITSGHKSRRKTVRVYGAATDAIVDLMRSAADREGGHKGHYELQ